MCSHSVCKEENVTNDAVVSPCVILKSIVNTNSYYTNNQTIFQVLF